jgi:uncharacterized membrane protein YdjX (TVP38/TMEM64 family)
MTQEGERLAAAVVPLASLHRTARICMLGVLAIGSLSAWHWRAVLDPLAIVAVIERYPGAPLLFLAFHILASLLFVPRTLLALAAGVLFGTAGGIFWAGIGSVAGAAAGFLVARYLYSGLADVVRGSPFGFALERVERGGWRSVALLRLIPIMPHSVANYGLGLTRLPLGAYAFGSLIGQLPMTIAYVELGVAGERYLTGSAGWVMPTLVGALAISLLLLLPAYSRWRSR